MLITQARLAMRNNQPVRLVGDMYHIIDIKRMNGTNRMIARIKRIGEVFDLTLAIFALVMSIVSLVMSIVSLLVAMTP